MTNPAPGTYATLRALVDAVNNATGTDSDVFSDNYQINVDSQYLFILDYSGPNVAGTTITFGPTDIAADLGFSGNPDTAVASEGDELQFFQGPRSVVQTVTGSLSTVVDPAAQAVLTSLISSLAAYGLIIDSTT